MHACQLCCLHSAVIDEKTGLHQFAIVLNAYLDMMIVVPLLWLNSGPENKARAVEQDQVRLTAAAVHSTPSCFICPGYPNIHNNQHYCLIL